MDKHYCRVLLNQARTFRLRGDPFSVVLLEWAGNARRRAMVKKGQQEMPL